MVCADIILVIKCLRVYSELEAQTRVLKAHHAFYGPGVMITPSYNHVFSSSCDTEASTLNMWSLHIEMKAKKGCKRFARKI